MSIAVYKAMLISLIELFAILTLIYVLVVRPIEKKWQRSRDQLKDFGFDVRYTVFHFIANGLVISPIFLLLRPNRQTGLFVDVLRDVPLWIQFCVAVLAWDFLHYGFHRFCHANKIAWSIHKSHHSSEQMHVLAGFRANVFSSFLVNGIGVFVVAVFGIDPKITFAFLLNYFLFNTIAHLDSRLRFGFLEKIIVTPHFHVWHHEETKNHRNLAFFFPFIDMIFGTYYLPKETPKKLGLGNEALPTAIKYHQLVPLYDWKVLKKMQTEP